MFVAIQDPTSLDKLHDIVVPEAVHPWPPAPGWYVLGGLVLILLVWLIVNATRHWIKNRYRRAAIEELNQLRQDSKSLEQRSHAIVGVDQILKRVALVTWPRQDVASLSGRTWMEFLNRTGRGNEFTNEQIEALKDVAYSSKISNQVSVNQLELLFESASRWIRQHRGPESIATKSKMGVADD